MDRKVRDLRVSLANVRWPPLDRHNGSGICMVRQEWREVFGWLCKGLVRWRRFSGLEGLLLWESLDLIALRVRMSL